MKESGRSLYELSGPGMIPWDQIGAPLQKLMAEREQELRESFKAENEEEWNAVQSPYGNVDPHRAVREEYERDKVEGCVLEMQDKQKPRPWIVCDTPNPQFYDFNNYRIQPHWRERKALAEGRTVLIADKEDDSNWSDIPQGFEDWENPKFLFEILPLDFLRPPDGRTLHNPENVTAEQVGPKHRLLLPEEVDDRHFDIADVWYGKSNWGKCLGVRPNEHDSKHTFRVPASTPWPPHKWQAAMDARAAGKPIEWRTCFWDKSWSDWQLWTNSENPHWWDPDLEYRPAPEPQYRPWTFETCPLGLVLTRKGIRVQGQITGKDIVHLHVFGRHLPYGEVFEDWTQLDGTPAGEQRHV